MAAKVPTGAPWPVSCIIGPTTTPTTKPAAPNLLRQQLALWALVLGLWCLLVTAFAGHLVFTNGLGWPEALALSCRDWLPWVILAPLVAWLAFRFPLERRKLYASIPVHVLACMVALVVCEVLARPPRLQPRRPGDRAGPAPMRSPQDEQDLGPRGPSQGPPPFRPPVPGGRNRPFLGNALARAQFNIPIYWAIVSIVHTLSFYRRSQERELRASELEGRLVEAKLQALRMQLHPHFLFNTLNAISTLVHKDPQAADEMIGNLSELLRATLDVTSQEIPLRQELAFLDRYIEIQQARFGDRLRIEKHIDAAALEIPVPALVLQPLVENAIRHGIEPKTTEGVVVLSARREPAALLLTVRDNGVGIQQLSDGDGIGLANTRARLQELYGDRAHLTLSSPAEGGCSIELEIPAAS